MEHGDSWGFGLGLRPQHFATILRERPPIDWFEIITENFLGVGGMPRRRLAQVRDHYPLVMHGVGLSIAGTDPIDRSYLKGLKELASQLEPLCVSDHLSWTRHRGMSSHDLLPIVYNESTLAHVAARVQAVQDHLDRRLYLENPSIYVAFRESDISEVEFLVELVRRTGCGVLLDLNNLYVNLCNLGVDPRAYLEHLSATMIGYMHLAGHTVTQNIRVDTHDAPVPEEVWSLYREAVARFPQVPTLVEWDGDVPEFAVLAAELQKSRDLHRQVVAETPPRATFAERKECRGIPGDHVSPRASSETSMDAWRLTQDCFWAAITGQRPVAESDSALLRLRADLPANHVQGINVYVDAYYLRLCGAARDVHPTLVNVMGQADFDAVFRDCIKKYPPHEASIKHVAAPLAAFLEESDLPRDYGVPPTVLADIAALEWARAVLFDAPDDLSTLNVETLAAIPPEDWAEMRFEMSSSLRLVPTRHEVGTVVQAVAAGKVPQRPEPRPSCYLVYRMDGVIEHETLSAEDATLLRALIDGATFGEAFQLLPRTEGEETVAVERAVRPLVAWVERGLVRALVVPSRTEEADDEF